MNVRNEVHAAFRASSQQPTPRTLQTPAARADVKSTRIEVLWAWASLLMLIVCWDAALRLDKHVSPPRMRVAQIADQDRNSQRTESLDPL